VILSDSRSVPYAKRFIPVCARLLKISNQSRT
jgi:hypothetical protein